MTAATPRKILIRAPNWVGDAVLSIPAIEAIGRGYPEARVTVMARPWVAAVFPPVAAVHDVWSVDKPTGAAAWLALRRRMRAAAFDLGLLLPNSFESALIMGVGGVVRRAGYVTDGRRWLLHDAIPRPTSRMHQARYYLNLAEAVTGKPEGSSTISLRIRPTDRERDAARAVLQARGLTGTGYIVLNPGAAYGAAKRWPEDRFAAAGQLLSRRLGVPLLVVGSGAERPIGERIRELSEVDTHVLCGQTSLEALIGVLADARVLITNDSGPMHLGAALGIPTVAVFGATDEQITGPLGLRARVVKVPVECSPCLLRECPIDHRCMTRVMPEQVVAAALELTGA